MTDSFEETWRRRFEGYASSHDDDAGIAGWSEAGLRCRLRNFERDWRPTEGGLWLDVGCGAGSYSRLLAARGMQVIGVDYSLPTLQKARARLGSPASRWVLADAGELPFRAESFDGALCFGVLQALSSPAAAVAELVRCVRPGGEVWIDALNADFAVTRWQRWRADEASTRLRYDRASRLSALCRRAGLEDVSVRLVPILPGRLTWLARSVESAPVRGLLHAVRPIGALLSHAFVVRGRKGGAAAASR